MSDIQRATKKMLERHQRELADLRAEIKRLRAELKELEQQDADVTNMLVNENKRLHVYLNEQVTEVERLREMLAIEGLSCKVAADIARQQAQIERLRSALEAILDDPEAGLNIAAYARTALGNGQTVDVTKVAPAAGEPVTGCIDPDAPHEREYEPGMNPIDDAEFGMPP